MTTGARWLAVIVWMGVIFFFSSQDGSQSAGVSAHVVQIVATELPEADPATLEVLVRKGAHFTEYAILGALLTWAWRTCSWASVWRPLATGALYAAVDEIHQLFVPGRAGQVGDVLIDTFGVIIGVTVLHLLRRRSMNAPVFSWRGATAGCGRNQKRRRRT